MTIDVRRATNRTRIEQPGIVTWHSFSAGPHYDPSNISFGALIAHDEHLLAAAAGFPKHAHRGVDIVSWVLDGELRHNGRRSVLAASCTSEPATASNMSKPMPGLIVHSGSCKWRCCRRRVGCHRRNSASICAPGGSTAWNLILRLPDAALYLARLSPRLPAQRAGERTRASVRHPGAASLGTGSIRDIGWRRRRGPDHRRVRAVAGHRDARPRR